MHITAKQLSLNFKYNFQVARDRTKENYALRTEKTHLETRNMIAMCLRVKSTHT